MYNSYRFVYPVVAAILVVVGIILGYNIHPNVDSARASKFEEVLDALDNKYVDSIDKNKIFDQTLNDMLHDLDPHSRYISLRDLKQEQESMQGSFGGIGVRFQLINDTISVIKAITDAPAYAAGVRSGDQIIEINRKPFTGKKVTTDRVMSSLKGEVDTEVEVTVFRNGQRKKIKITRGEIPMETVSTAFMLKNDVGFLRIDQFSVPTHEEFVAAAQILLDKGMKKMVLDLRDNPGGVMDAAIAIADEFLPNGDVIVSTKGKHIKNDVAKASEGGLLEKMEVVVLINEGTASAAEILAGALQDNDRGFLVGRRTYGKGLVQQDQILSDGSSVRMTISRYFTPSGRSIQRPYSGDYKAYMQDESRYLKGELFFKDSMPIDKKLVYKTKKGRKVYGGGGVVPDYFVAMDTTGGSLYLTGLSLDQVFSAYVFKSLQGNRNRWNSAQALSAYSFTKQDINSFTGFAKTLYRVDGFQYLNAHQKERIKQRLKQEFARQLWEEMGVYTVTSTYDFELQKALTILH